MRHFRSILPALLVVGLVPATSSAAPAQVQIQPGARISTPIGGCTTNFVYTDDAANLYIGTAGHCGSVGMRVNSADGNSFGEIIFSENAYPVSDFALILIDPEDVASVSPAMRYWGGPTGMTIAEDVEQGDLILSYGYGVGFGSTEQTRRRAGLLTLYRVTDYSGLIAGTPGDSGGPIVHAETGKALGIINVLKLGAPQGGTTVENALRRARFLLDNPSLRVVTAPLEPIPQ